MKAARRETRACDAQAAARRMRDAKTTSAARRQQRWYASTSRARGIRSQTPATVVRQHDQSARKRDRLRRSERARCTGDGWYKDQQPTQERTSQHTLRARTARSTSMQTTIKRSHRDARAMTRKVLRIRSNGDAVRTKHAQRRREHRDSCDSNSGTPARPAAIKAESATTIEADTTRSETLEGEA